MEEEKETLQFDALLGGTETLPHEVHVFKFAAARSKEIAAMTECIMNPCSSKLLFQNLPVHMRRRIMSHNSKRLPRKLRLAHESQLKKGGTPLKQKRPSRKHRRRPRILLSEYNRRQREFVWLETHIWHAKRFHMTKKWGYKLPQAPCDKAFRACYRAGSKHCLLQDISYCQSVQICGKVEELIKGFDRITSSKCGLKITSQAYMTGKREGSSYIFNLDSYPFECIGKVTFLWKRPEDSDLFRTVWIFVHPSFYTEFMNLIIKCFNLEDDENVVQPAKRRKTTDSKNVETENNLEKMNKTYKNENSIKMIELKGKINKFRLTGPLSHAVLSEALYPIQTDVSNPNKTENWFVNTCERNEHRTIHDIQSQFWNKFKNLNSPSELPCHLIVCLNVEDPRIAFPQKRKKALPQNETSLKTEDYVLMPDGLNFSHLWNENIQKKVSCKIITNLEINKLREKSQLVPGACSDIFKNIPGVPIILIQRPGSQDSSYKRIGYNSGWDVILPSGYGMAFWLSFILRGGRAGGLREVTKLAFESGTIDIQPDTSSSQREELQVSELLREKYFRLPPNKRVNFAKLSINSPFLCRWLMLVNDWRLKKTDSEFFSVLRDKTVLNSLKEMLKNKKIDSSFNWDQNCLIPVKLLACKKGKLSNFSLICLPNSNDHMSKKSCELVEPLAKDRNENKRKLLRLNHKISLKKLRRKWVKAKKKILETSEKYVKVPKQNNSKMIEIYSTQMKELWLPSKVDNVRNQCSREVMGYVTHGDFSFTEARGFGVGYVTLPSLLSIIKESSGKDCLVLVRSTKSRQYRFAKMEIICQV